MRKKCATGLVGLLLLAACSVSHVDPNAVIDISGTVSRQNGAPAPDAPLALLREGDVGDVLATITSLGLTCLSGQQAPAICHNARRTSTGSDGTFTYTLKGRDTQSTFGFSAVLSVTTKLPAKSDEVSGSTTTYRFHVQTKQLQLPIRMWEPILTARTGPFGARVTFPRIGKGFLARPLEQGTIRYTIDFVRGREPVWELTDAHPVTTFDPRLLEDSTGTLRVTAIDSDLHVSEQLGDEVAFGLGSGARAYQSPLAPPPSRGKACSIVDQNGKSYDVSPCRITDGDFGTPFSPSLCTGEARCLEPRHVAAVIDLGAPSPVGLIVLRGCDHSCRVDTSEDRRRWASAGATDESEAAFPLSPEHSVRYVRVSAQSVDALTEVSAWSGAPRLPDASLLVSPAKFPTTSSDSTTTSGSAERNRLTWWALVAALLIGGLVGATVVVFGRRRRDAR